MTEPDELYTLRAQYWLGHYQLAVEEARSVARRPMSPALKAEREEFLARAHIALGQYDKVAGSASAADSPGASSLIWIDNSFLRQYYYLLSIFVAHLLIAFAWK